MLFCDLSLLPCRYDPRLLDVMCGTPLLDPESGFILKRFLLSRDPLEQARIANPRRSFDPEDLGRRVGA